MAGALPPTLIATFLGLRCYGLGIRSSRTPLANLALRPSVSIPSGKVSERTWFESTRVHWLRIRGAVLKPSTIT